jgi:uncharacterized protein (DUF1330 family)
MSTSTIDPTAEQIGRLAASAVSGPIVMLNLLRFKDRADGIDAPDGLSGREAYERYGEAVAPYLAAAGGRITFLAECGESVIGPDGEAWDMLILVRYPSRRAFLEMVTDPGFQAAHTHRAGALLDSRLVCCHELLGAAISVAAGAEEALPAG